MAGHRERALSQQYVVDTHALFWYLVDSPRLSESGRRIFQDALAGEVMLILSPIVLLELYGLLRKVKAPVLGSGTVVAGAAAFLD